MTVNSTTPGGVPDTPVTDNAGFENDSDAVNALLKKWEDAPEGEPSDAEKNEGQQEETEEVYETEDSEEDSEEEVSEEDGEEGQDTEDEEGEETDLELASDDAVVTLTVDGEEVQASVKDLKRLYGQEASLTKKSQQVAETRKAAEEQLNLHAAATAKLLERAKERLEPYSKIDFLALSRNQDISDAELASLQADAKAAADDVKFLSEELHTVISNANEARQKDLQEKAEEAMKVIQDPDNQHYIADWSLDYYNGLLKYADSQGFDANEITDPALIKLITKAKAYDEGKKVATKKKAKVAPKKVIKKAAKSVNPKAAGLGWSYAAS